MVSAMPIISTGEFFITEGNLDEIFCELSKINPSELLLSIKAREIEPLKAVPEKEADIDEKIWKNYPYTLINRSFYNADFNSELQNENLLEYEIGLKCAGSIVNYAKLTQKNFMPKLDIIKKYSISNHLIMNAKTREALELNKNSSVVSLKFLASFVLITCKHVHSSFSSNKGTLINTALPSLATFTQFSHPFILQSSILFVFQCLSATLF